ncbi:MAG: hypothetical protein IPG93_26240 [Burkholderiales bacterium]|nr:hypothetical protein [Burkholderiales bacterium]
MVDHFMHTTVPHIYAAGDVAQGATFHRRMGGPCAAAHRNRRHGRIAAINHGRQDHAVPRQPEHERARHRQADLAHLRRVAGPRGWQMVELTDEPRFSTRLCFHDDRMIGAITVAARPCRRCHPRSDPRAAVAPGPLEGRAAEQPSPGHGGLCRLTQNPAVDS